jgi:hypothetical protein
MVNVKVQDHIFQLLKSRSWEVAGGACLLVGRLASHEHTVSAIWEADLLQQLVLLAR